MKTPGFFHISFRAFSVIGLASCLLPFSSNAQESAAPPPPPPNPLIGLPPMESSWTMRTDKAPNSTAAPSEQPPPLSEAIRKGPKVAIKRPGPGGKPLWTVIIEGFGFFQPPHFAEGDIIVTDHRSGPNQITGHGWFFPELKWVSAANYKGVVKWQGRPAHHFSTAGNEADAQISGPGQDIDPRAVEAMKADRKAGAAPARQAMELWTDVETGLPIAFKNAAGIVLSYSFGSSKPWPTLPPSFEKAIQAHMDADRSAKESEAAAR